MLAKRAAGQPVLNGALAGLEGEISEVQNHWHASGVSGGDRNIILSRWVRPDLFQTPVFIRSDLRWKRLFNRHHSQAITTACGRRVDTLKILSRRDVCSP